MKHESTRREFMRTTTMGVAAAALAGRAAMAQEPAAEAPAPKDAYAFEISLAGWSLHRMIGRGEDQIDNLEMPRIAKETFDIHAIELVSGMMASDEPDYVAKMGEAAAAHGVKILLIMIDGQGNIGADRERQREVAVDNHMKWIDRAASLGCHSIRMNWKGEPKNAMEDPAALEDFIERSAAPFRTLCEYGDTKNINILLENHWGPSSYPDAVEKLAKAIAHPRWGTLPDFGNFPEDVDMYEGVDRLMPFAKALSAKCYDFDDATGEETKIDFKRMLDISCGKHGYNGYVGIEFEGGRLTETEGIKAAKALLEKYRVQG
jgi:sugar phosphate isomerase/epimerase